MRVASFATLWGAEIGLYGTYTLAEHPMARIRYGRDAALRARRTSRPCPQEPRAVLRRQAVELGVNHIDTAQY